jgi:acyl-CoA thioesterase-2
MTVIESAWPSHPNYRIDLEAVPGIARVWYGDLLVAESSAALRVIETDHVHRLYFPEDDVHLDLFEENDHHSICPFKGEADYWTLTASESPAEDIFWTYRTPLAEVAGLAGYLGAYHEKAGVRVEIESPTTDGAGSTTHAFPE